MTRTEIDLATLLPGEPYRLLNTCVIPRPIAWVSTISASGVPNLAPHSFFTVASNDPPTVMFSSVGLKDTLRNIREVPECVVNIASEPMAVRINETSTNFPSEVDEFLEVGLTPEPSLRVRPARVAQSPVVLECEVTGTHDVGSSTVVFCRVVHVAFDSEIAAADGMPDSRLVAPVTRLGRDQWATLGEVFSLSRIPYAKWQGPAPD